MNKILLSLTLGLGLYGVSYAEVDVTEEVVETAIIEDTTAITDPMPEETVIEPESGVQASINEDGTRIMLEIRLPIFDINNVELSVVGDDKSPTKFLLGYERQLNVNEEATKSIETEEQEEIITDETKVAEEREEKPEGFILVLPDDVDPESMQVERDVSVLRIIFDLVPQEQHDEEVDVEPDFVEEEIIVEDTEDDEKDDEDAKEEGEDF